LDWDNFGSVVDFSTGSDVVSAILNGTEKVLSQAILAITRDEYSLVKTIIPNNGINERNGIQVGVIRNTTIQFQLSLYVDIDNPDLYNINTTVILRYVGFSSPVTFNIDNSFQCLGCDPSNSSLFVDDCGVCGGNNSLCTGCDGVLNSGVFLDRCDVCGGDNSSCQGCSDIVFGLEYDLCGVCNGTNDTCLGCDGQYNSGKRLNSCGVCGGPVNCASTLVPVIIALSVFAGIAAAALLIALLLGLCVRVKLAQIDEMMIEEEAALQENPLYEQAKKRFDNPFFGTEKPNEG